MTAQAADEDVILDEDNVTHEDVTTSTEDDKETQEKTNSSNWKKMSEAKKAAEAKASALETELETLKTWANSLYEDDAQKPFKKEEKQVDSKADMLEKKVFLIENKEAKEHMELVDGVRAKYSMDYEDAWDFVKAKLPKESVSKTAFDVKGKAPVTPKDLTKVSMEDSMSLSKEDRSKWRQLNGMSAN